MKRFLTLIYYAVIASIPIEVSILLGEVLGGSFIIIGIVCFFLLEYYYVKKVNITVDYKMGSLDNLIFSIIFPILFFLLSALNNFVFDHEFRFPNQLELRVVAEVYITFFLVFFIIWHTTYLLCKPPRSSSS